ncbi:MAG: elongation factor 1-beta family protein [Candidatus Marsarchaeota archaeon]|nr:elongation factor 1-beta family protein [Candidatus Marsarchaeota archaeon]
MGDVAVLFRIYAEEGKEESVRKEIADTLKPKGSQLEEVAFGIKTIKALFVHDDAHGSSEIEEKLRKLPGVKEVEIVEESLV